MSNAVDEVLQEDLKEFLEKTGYTEEQFKGMKDAVMNGASLGDVLGMSKEALEAGYTLAYNFYSAGNYNDAETMFRGLCLYENDDPRFWMGLAACLQARADFQNAVDAYSMASFVGNMKDPEPIFYAATCYLKMGDKENAKAALKGAQILGTQNNPAHQACQAKIEALLAALTENGE